MPTQNISKKLSQFAEYMGVPDDICHTVNGGCCSGLATVWLYAKWLELNGLPKRSHHQPINDADWFWKVIHKFNHWDGKRDLSKNDFSLFYDFFSYVFLYQSEMDLLSNKVGSVAQGDIDQSFADTKNRQLNKTYSLASLMNIDQATIAIKQTFIDNELVIAQSQNHTVGILKCNDTFYYYDSITNSEEEYRHAGEVAEALFDSFEFDYDRPSPMGFRMFSFSQTRYSRPSQNEVLNEIRPRINQSKTYADGITSLHMAAIIGCEASAKYHLASDLNIVDKHDLTPLHLASETGRLSIVKMLLDHRAKLTLDDRKENPTLKAASEGYNAIVKRLIKAGDNISQASTTDKTALLCAAHHGHVKTVKLLCQEGAEVNHLDYHGKSALTYAAREGHLEAVKYLLKFNADVNQEDNNGYTPIFYAVRGHFSRIMHKLIKHGKHLNLNYQTKLGTSVFMLAAATGDVPIMEMLKQEGADMHLTDKGGKNALNYAKDANHPNAIAWLQKQSLQANSMSNSEESTDESELMPDFHDLSFTSLSTHSFSTDRSSPSSSSHRFFSSRDREIHASDADSDTYDSSYTRSV